MIRKNQRIINTLNLLSDAGLIFAAYFAALFIRFSLLHGVHNSPGRGWELAVAAVYSVLLVLVYHIARLYGSYRFKQPGDEALLILFINAAGVLCLMSVLYFTRFVDFSRLALFLFWLLSSFLVIAKRAAVRALLRHYRKLGYNQKHVVVVGNGHFARQYIQDIRANPHMGVTVDGYLSQFPRNELGRCLGSYEQLGEVLQMRHVDDVVIALEPHEIRFMKMILSAADKEGARISIIPFYNDYIPTHPTIDVVGQTKLVNMRATPLDNIGCAILKRATDIAGALLLILLTCPLMLVTAVGVKLSSPGPVLFKQDRVGKDKKVFKMWKFRSMRVTSTQNTGWSTQQDPRKTPFGSFIRKFSIDELPQASNVLAGQMSLVGPRPEVPYHVSHFKEEIPLYLVRQQVRPGITGWAQVNGLRGDTSIEDRVKHDIWYIENWSLMLDLKIIFRTLTGGLINKEALKPKEEATL